MKRVLVTGGHGFLGGHLTRAMVGRGDAVVVLGRDRTRGGPFWVLSPEALVWGDVQDLALLRRVIAEYGIDTVVHLAAQTQVSVGQANPEGVIRENINGAISVLEACRLQRVNRIVVASTDKVYGESTGAYVESTPMLERTPYGMSKACVDMIAQTYLESYDMPVAITRCGNLYGPGHMNWSTLIPGTIRRLYIGERPVVRFGGEATRDFLHVDDAVRAYMRLIDSSQLGAFNFSGGTPMKILDVVMLLCAAMSKPANVDIREGAVGEIKHQELDCRRARDLIHWRPEVPLPKGLKETAEWYQRYLSSTTGSTSSPSCSAATKTGS